MLEIFKPDLFSRSDILFGPSNTATFQQVVEVIQDHYRFLADASPSKVEQLGGLEVNSNNFRLTFGNDQFVLKRAGVNSIATILEQQYDVSERLRAKAVVLPEVLRNQDGNYVSRARDGRNWILTRFVPGAYFSGHPSELMAIGDGIGAMMARLKEMAPLDLPVNPAVHGSKNFQTSFDRLMHTKRDWHKYFPEADVFLLRHASQQIQEVGEIILSRLDDLEELPCGPCHIDLHPHNILVKSRELSAIVDMDSIQNSRVAISLGFAVFKLVRQYAVHSAFNLESGQNIAKMAVQFISSILSRCEISEEEIHSLQLSALFEVYRRLLSITDLNICKSDFVWNRVLSIQLAALTEIPIIFSEVSQTSFDARAVS